MSYILDAVRKADQERRENLAPVARSLGAQSQSKMPETSRLGAHWPAIIAGAILVNLAGWYWTLATPEANSAVAAELPPAIDSIATVEPLAASQIAQTRQPHKVPLWQAPVDAQNAVRSLDFSFHVYATDPSRRTIIINGQRIAEKERISQDLALNEITNSGVILAYQSSLLVEVDILEQW